MLRHGLVDRVDAAAARARVVFGGDDALASMLLPVLQHKAHGDQSYWMPDVGDYVACLLDERAEFGVVLGAFYTEDNEPPVASLDKFHAKFRDGTTVEYDRAAHTLAISVAASGAVTVTAGSITASANEITLNVPSDGTVQVGGAGGDQLVCKSWVDARFELHSHPVNGAPPTPVVPVPFWFTQRARGK